MLRYIFPTHHTDLLFREKLSESGASQYFKVPLTPGAPPVRRTSCNCPQFFIIVAQMDGTFGYARAQSTQGNAVVLFPICCGPVLACHSKIVQQNVIGPQYPGGIETHWGRAREEKWQTAGC
jgi:hypothetical protein